MRASKPREHPRRTGRSAPVCQQVPRTRPHLSTYLLVRGARELLPAAGHTLLAAEIMKVIKTSASVFQFCKLPVHNALIWSFTTSEGCLWLLAWITMRTSPTCLAGPWWGCPHPEGTGRHRCFAPKHEGVVPCTAATTCSCVWRGAQSLSTP